MMGKVKSLMTRPITALFSIGSAFSLAASAVFFWLWYTRFVLIDFNELGRYYDANEKIVYTDAAFVWILPALFFLALAATLTAQCLFQRKSTS